MIPTTVGEVLEQIDNSDDRSRLRDTCIKFADIFAMSIPVEEILLDDIFEKKERFRFLLSERHYGRKSRESQFRQLTLLLTKAAALGWDSSGFLSDKWRSLLPEARRNRCAELVLHCARLSLTPNSVTREHVVDWVDRQVIEWKRTFNTAWSISADFTSLLLHREYTNVNPIAAARLDNYGIPLDQFPLTLQKQVRDLLIFRTNSATGADDIKREACDDDEEDIHSDDSDTLDDSPIETQILTSKRITQQGKKNKRIQIRAVSAQTLEGNLCRLYGYLKQERNRNNLTSIKQLYAKKALERYRYWLIDKRKAKPWSVRTTFAALVGAAKQCRLLDPYKVRLDNFLRTIPNEPDAQRRARMALKCLPFSKIEEIPQMILDERTWLEESSEPLPNPKIRAKSRTKTKIAHLAMQELFIRWIILLPWRSRNLCECTVRIPVPQENIQGKDATKNQPFKPFTVIQLPKADKENLFRESLPRYRDMRLPESTKELLLRDPTTEVWQYDFSAKQVKGNSRIHRLLPQSLIDPLNTYLKYREALVTPESKNRLFLAIDGKPLTTHSLYCMICDITLAYGGKRASIKVLRDMFAFNYLMKNPGPKCFERLASLLWHKDTNTTRRYYATQYGFGLGNRRGREIS